MALTLQEITNLMNQNSILSNSSIEEQLDFITEQIQHPFENGTTNYFKRIRKTANPDNLNNICIRLIHEIENIYPDLDVDIESMVGVNGEKSLVESFNALYKFFTRNIQKLMIQFIWEYIKSPKNQKILTADYLNIKMPNYPKEQYGKKEYYILVVKLPAIVKDIFDSDIRLEKFIECIERSGMSPMYFRTIKQLLDTGLVIDHGVVNNIFKLFKKSDQYDKTICDIQSLITSELIIPYMEKNGMAALRIPTPDALPEDLDEDDDDETPEEE